MDFGNVPLGFGFALAQNDQAMAAYAAMSETQRQEVLARAHNVRSKQEMNQLVSGLAGGTA